MAGRRAAAAADADADLPGDRELFFKLVRLINLTARPFVETLARRHRLSLTEWRIMVVLASEPGTAAHEVAEITGLDKMSVSRAVAALARQGRVVKRDDPRDARRAQLELSAAGHHLYQQIGRGGRAREQLLFAPLGAAERQCFEHTVDRLIHELQQQAPAAGIDAVDAGFRGSGELVTTATISSTTPPNRRVRRPTP